MKRSNSLALVVLSLVLSLVLGACASDEPMPRSTPITAEESARIAADPQFEEAVTTLRSDGYAVALDAGLVYRRAGEYAAVFPVTSDHPNDQEYSSVTYREADGAVRVVLTADGAPREAGKGVGEQRQNLSCGEWSKWYSLDASWCEGCFPNCLFEGFKGIHDREWRLRQCCDATGHCWGETEYRTVRKSCGC